MTKEQAKAVERTHLDALEASKQFVTQTKTWATTMREAVLAPWTEVSKDNEMVSMMVNPWISMTRMTHDRWLDTFETQSHQLIDKNHEMVRSLKKLPQL